MLRVAATDVTSRSNAQPRSPRPRSLPGPVYKNMAALDGLNERSDAVTEQIMDDLPKQGEGMASRGKAAHVPRCGTDAPADIEVKR